MQLDLIANWFDSCIAQQICKKLETAIREPYTLDVALIDQGLQFEPDLVHGFLWCGEKSSRAMYEI